MIYWSLAVFLKHYLNVNLTRWEQGNLEGNHEPVFGGGRSVSLPTVFKPVPYLSRREAGCLGQFPFFGRVWVWVLQVPFSQQAAGPLFETVRFLLAVPDGPGQGKLLTDAVLIDRPQWATPQFLGLLVVRFEPHRLKLAVRFLGELVVL